MIPTCRRRITIDGDDGLSNPAFTEYVQEVSAYSPVDQFLMFSFGDILLLLTCGILHWHSSLLSFYAPLLENSVVVLMNYDEIKSFSFLKQYSLQEL